MTADEALDELRLELELAPHATPEQIVEAVKRTLRIGTAGKQVLDPTEVWSH